MDRGTYLGIKMIDGQRQHLWASGFHFPAIYGSEGDEGSEGGTGEGGEGGTDDEGEEGGSNDDGDIDYDDPTSIEAIKDPKQKRVAQEAAKYRIRARTAREQRDTIAGERDKLKGEIDALQKKIKDGSGDEQLKARLTTLEEDNKRLLSERDAVVRERDESRGKLKSLSVAGQIRTAAGELKVQEDADFVQYLLDRNNLLVIDEDGSAEDLAKHIKKMVKEGKLHVASGDSGDGTDKSGVSGTPSSGKPHNGSKGKPSGLDRATLEAKFPALRR